MYTLDEHGICKHCKKDAQAEFMECWICQEKYHVIECDTEPMIQPSFLRNQWGTMMKKWPCMTFTCPLCRENVKTKEEAIMSGRVRLLEETSLKSNKRLEDIMDLLNTLVTKPQEEGNLRDTYSNVLTKDGPSLIVIDKPASNEPLNEAESQAKMDEVKKAAIQSKVSVNRSYINKSGRTVFVCNNTKSKEALLPHVQKVFSTRKITTPKPKLPTITVPFIEDKYDNQDLLTALRNQNEEYGILFDADNTQVLFMAPMKDKDRKFQAVLRVAEDVRERIKANGDRLFIGSSSCPVYDRFFVKRCNRCQGFHHFQKDYDGCKRAAVCALCTGNHDTRGCHTDEHMYKCVNCEKSGQEDFMHAAHSLHCPSYIAEQTKLRKSINYYAKNP